MRSPGSETGFQGYRRNLVTTRQFLFTYGNTFHLKTNAFCALPSKVMVASLSARGRQPGHAPDGEGEQEAPLEQDWTGGRREKEEKGLRSDVESVGRDWNNFVKYLHAYHNGKGMPACVRECEIPQP